MPNSPNTSFIPKQGPIRRPRQAGSRQVHVLSIISYIVLAAALLASAGVFFYKGHVENKLENEVANLNRAIANFSEADMEEVRAFNARLAQTRSRLDNGVSVVAVLEALEEATLKSASLKSLNWERQGDELIAVSVEVDTDTFDSSLFQRGILERSDIVETVEVEDLAIVDGGSEDDDVMTGVGFTANISIPISNVPNLPKSNAAFETTTFGSDSTASTTESTLSDDVSNNTQI